MDRHKNIINTKHRKKSRPFGSSSARRRKGAFFFSLASASKARSTPRRDRMNKTNSAEHHLKVQSTNEKHAMNHFVGRHAKIGPPLRTQLPFHGKHLLEKLFTRLLYQFLPCKIIRCSATIHFSLKQNIHTDTNHIINEWFLTEWNQETRRQSNPSIAIRYHADAADLIDQIFLCSVRVVFRTFVSTSRSFWFGTNSTVRIYWSHFDQNPDFLNWHRTRRASRPVIEKAAGNYILFTFRLTGI